MPFTHRVGQTYSSNNGTVSSVTTTLTSDSEVAVDATIAAATTDRLVDVRVVVARLQSFVMYSSTAVTVETNSASTPTNTITIPAGGSVVWYTGAPYANPLTADVTSLFVTNSGATAANFKFAALVDATP